MRHDDNLGKEDDCGGGSGWRDVLRVEGTFSVFPVRALVLAQEGGRRESAEICFENPKSKLQSLVNSPISLAHLRHPSPHKPESSSCKSDRETPRLRACCSVNQASANCRLMLGVREHTGL